MHEHGETAYNHTPVKAYIPELKVDVADPKMQELSV